MKRTLAALAVGAGLVLALPQAASAGVQDVGVFTRNPAASIPEGGLQVANAPDGRVTYSAISVFEDADTITSASLTLTELTGNGQSVNAASAAIRVCPAAGTFKAGRGALADGPKDDCLVGSVPLTRATDGKWTAEVGPLLKGDPAAIAIVPAEGAGVYQVTFGPPDLVVVAGESTGGDGASIGSDFDASEFGGTAGGDSSSSSSTSSFDSSEFSDSSGSSSSSSFDSGSSSLGGGSTFSGISSATSTFSAPVEAPPIDGTAASTATGAAAEVALAPEVPTRERLAGTPASSSSPGNTGVQFVFFVVVAAVIGTGAGVARNRLVTAKAA